VEWRVWVHPGQGDDFYFRFERAEYQDLNEAMCQAMGEYQKALREAIEARGRDEAIRQALGILGGWGLTAQPVSIRPKGGGQR